VVTNSEASRRERRQNIFPIFKYSKKSSAHASTANNKQKGYSLGSGADQPGNDQYDSDRDRHDGSELHVGGDFDLRHYESPGILDAFGTVNTNRYKALFRVPRFYTMVIIDSS
jgi:hypothetical protein